LAAGTRADSSLNMFEAVAKEVKVQLEKVTEPKPVPSSDAVALAVQAGPQGGGGKKNRRRSRRGGKSGQNSSEPTPADANFTGQGSGMPEFFRQFRQLMERFSGDKTPVPASSSGQGWQDRATGGNTSSADRGVRGGSSRGRGGGFRGNRGGSSWRGRGTGASPAKPGDTCHNCGKLGHWQRECRSGKGLFCEPCYWRFEARPEEDCVICWTMGQNGGLDNPEDSEN